MSASVALGSDAKTWLDLSEVYGPPVAIWLPLGACSVSHVTERATHSPAMVAGLAWLTKRNTKDA